MFTFTFFLCFDDKNSEKGMYGFHDKNLFKNRNALATTIRQNGGAVPPVAGAFVFLKRLYNMKWFKHISDSLDDPFIFDLVERFGGDGYLVFFGVLEIYSREFKPELNWNLSVTQAYLKAKLHKRQATLVVKILKHIQNSGKWEITLNGDQITIFIPKFTTLIDEWTQRKLGSKSGQAPKILKTDKEEEEDKEEDNNIPPISPKPKSKKLTPPTLDEVQAYFSENGIDPAIGKEAFDYYEAGNWHDSQGKPVKNWKQKMRGVWFKNNAAKKIKSISDHNKQACAEAIAEMEAANGTDGF